MIADNLITSDVASITVIPDEYLYFLSFRIKDKNSDSYAWRYVTGEEWDITGSTIVVKGLNGLVIWPNVFYSDEPQNCQISISFKGLTYNRGLTFKTTWTRPPPVPTWEEQFQIDYANGDLSKYSITAKFDYGTTSYSFTVNYKQDYITVINLPEIKIYFDGNYMNIPFNKTLINIENLVQFRTRYEPSGNYLTAFQGFEVLGGVVKYYNGYEYYAYRNGGQGDMPNPYNTSINLPVDITVKNKTQRVYFTLNLLK